LSCFVVNLGGKLTSREASTTSGAEQRSPMQATDPSGGATAEGVTAAEDADRCGNGSDACSSSAAATADQALAEKHQLQHTWSLWALQRDPSTKDDWHGSQMNVCEFGYVEDFWRVFNNIRRPSRLGIVDFSCFKKDIHPAWEDETCRQGGRWIAKLEKAKPEDLDELWLNLVLTIIGENFEDVGGRCICGAVVSSRIRGSSKVALWLSEREIEKVMPLGHAFRAVLKDSMGFSGDLAFEDFSQGGTGNAAFLLSSGTSSAAGTGSRAPDAGGDAR